MEPYRRNDRSGEAFIYGMAAAADGGALAALIVLIVVIVVIAMLVIWWASRETYTVYDTYAVGQDTSTSRDLWGVLVVFIATLVIAGLLVLAQVPVVGIYLASFSFLAFVIALVVIEARAPKPQPEPVVSNLSDVLRPWAA
ncbi:MAG: hypothetical protein ACKVVP_07275 [Chloroflexota bacterium]